MKNSTASLFLAVLITAASLSFAMVSCGKTEKNVFSEDTAKGGAASIQTTDGEGKFNYIDEYVGALASGRDFGGKSFVVVGDRRNTFPTEDELTGNLENDALFNRQREIENLFNIKMEPVHVEQGEYDGPDIPIADKVYDDVSSGINSFDLVAGNIMICGRLMLSRGTIRSVDDMEGVDLERDWWLNDIEAQLSLGGRLFGLTGKISATHYSDASAILFSKKLAADYAMEDPYPLVRDGEWTLDKMLELASVIPSGSGIYRYMIAHPDGLAYYYGGGFSISERGADGVPYVPDQLSSDAADYIEKLSRIFSDTSVTYNYKLKNTVYNGSMENDEVVFEKGGALFWTDVMGRAVEMRDYNVEFGILPIPKKDSAQKDYVSMASAWNVCGVFVPINVKDETVTGCVVEATAALSEKYLEPAFYDRALLKGSVYDAESKDVLDLIYHSKKFDLADTFQLGGEGDGAIVNIIDDNASGKRENLSSAYPSAARVSKRQIGQIMKQIENYEKDFK